MKKFIFILTILLSFNCCYAEQLLDNIQLPVRGYDGIELPAGSFIQVVNAQDISTQYCPEGYKVKFITTNDLYLYDTNVIPKGAELYGYIEKINEPVVGTNASMKIKISKLVLNDLFEIPIKGYVHTSNNNLIGGELTAPDKFITVPHYQQRFQGRFWSHRGPSLMLRPGPKRKMGEHTKLNAGEQCLIILIAPAEITHVVTN